ncbi:hypothetical protein BAC3_01341 [uncultured bacterium]|nr:hypothetical protein BAC3_01341 [uncultured bacterium]
MIALAFELLIAKQALGVADIEDFSDWAESLLMDGCELDNVAILASLGVSNDTDLEEVERYFSRCITDLKLVVPNQQTAIWNYAQELAKAIVANTLKPSTGLGLLKSFWIATDYTQPLYSLWYDLAVDVYSLNNDDVYLWNAELQHEDTNEFIIKMAQQFLDLSQYDTPEHFFDLTACFDCGHIGYAANKRIEVTWLAVPLFRLIYGRNPTMQPVCSHCGSAHLKSMRDYEGRAMYLLSKQAIQHE